MAKGRFPSGPYPITGVLRVFSADGQKEKSERFKANQRRKETRTPD